MCSGKQEIVLAWLPRTQKVHGFRDPFFRLLCWHLFAGVRQLFRKWTHRREVHIYALSTCLSTRWVEDGFASDHANPFLSLCRCPMEPTCHACGSTAHSKRDCPNTEKMCDLCGRVFLCYLFHECGCGRSGCGRALTISLSCRSVISRSSAVLPLAAVAITVAEAEVEAVNAILVEASGIVSAHVL